MSHPLVRRTIAGGASLAALASVALTVAAPAHAALPPVIPGGKITYNTQDATYIANANGSATVLVNGSRGGSWSPDGSRFAYLSDLSGAAGIRTVRPDGSNAVQVTTDGTDSTPVWSAYGQRIYFSRGGKLLWASSDGSQWIRDLGENTDTSTQSDVHPSVSSQNVIIFERDKSGSAPAIYLYNPSDPANPSLLIPNAAYPAFSPDGTKIAYESVGATAADTKISTVPFDGTKVTGSPTALIGDTAGAFSPAWSPDGQTILYTRGSNYSGTPVMSISSSGGTPVQVASNGYAPSWQPIRNNFVDRVWGQNAVGTAIAASQWNYRDNGNTTDPVRSPANAVVLSRADAFYDALAGSALAISKQAPLLITYPSSLDANVQAEIKRVLGTSGTVYLLGGPAALPAAIADKLTSLGYTVKRLAGATAIETAIAVDQEITGGKTPTTTIVATASEYYDALAAGTAAGANPGTTIVLTWGDYMPDASANYLNGLNPDWHVAGGTAVVAAGGPGDRALNSANLPSWPASAQYFSLVGANAKDTALLLAKFFFSAPSVAAVATSAGWYDALTGGAMIGAAGGPLLLTDPSGLYGPVADYLSANSGGMWDGVILGGTAALPDTLKAPIGEAISLPGGNPPYWTYTSIQPTTGTPSARGLTAQSDSTTATGPAGKAAADQRITGTLPGISRTAPSTLTR